MKNVSYLLILVQIFTPFQSYGSMRCFKALAAAAVVHVSAPSTSRADIYPDFSEMIKPPQVTQYYPSSFHEMTPWEGFRLVPGFGDGRPLKHTLDIDLLNRPLIDIVVEAKGPLGTLTGRNFFIPNEPNVRPFVIQENRGVAIRITKDGSKMKTFIYNEPGKNGMKVEREGDAELFLTWAGKPKKDAKTFHQPSEYEGFHDPVDLTVNGGDRFVVKHSGAPAKVQFRVYPVKDSESYYFAEIELPQTSVPTEFYLPFTVLQPLDKNTPPLDLTKVSAVSIKYDQKNGTIPLYELDPCNGCQIQQIPATIPSDLHYVGVAGIDSFPSSGGFGPEQAATFPPLHILMPPTPLNWNIYPPHYPWIPPKHHQEKEPEVITENPPTYEPPPPGNPVPNPPAIVLAGIAIGIGVGRKVIKRFQNR